MRTKLFVIAIVLAASVFGQGKGAPACDRACLEPFVDKYLDAMVAHDPSKAPFARGVKFTENGQRLELGDGLWNTMTGKGTFRLFVTDVEAQQVAFLGTIQEANVGAVIGLRLRIRDEKITEAEHFVQRSPNSAAGFERIGYKWTDVVPPAERMSRDELVKTANMYFSGMQRNDGKGDYPFADDCNRIENGGLTTNQPVAQGKQRPDPKTATGYSGNWSCMEQFKSGLLHFVTRIRDRRYVAVDPERGLVFSFRLLRSFRRRHAQLRNARWPQGDRGPAAALDLADRGAIPDPEGTAAPDPSDHGALSLWDERGLELVGRRTERPRPRRRETITT